MKKIMSIEDYHAEESISKSKLDLIDKSLRHFTHPVQRETDYFNFGHAVHDCILSPDVFAKKYVRVNDSFDARKKEYKEIKEGDKDPEAVKSVKKKLNSVLPKGTVLEDTGDYDKKLKESLVTTIRLMKSLGILDPSYKEDTSKITLDFQKKLDEYIKEVEQIRKDLPK